MVTLCSECCDRLDVNDIKDVVSECHRKYCYGCGRSSDDGLTSISKRVFFQKAKEKQLLK